MVLSILSYYHPLSVRQSDCQCFTVPCLDLWVCLATIRWLGRMAAAHQCPSKEICEGFNPEQLAYWPLSSTAAPPARMIIKEEILSTNPEIAKQSEMVKIRRQARAVHGVCGLAATVAVICSSTKHAFPTVLSRWDALPRGVSSCLLLEQVAEETVSTHF